MGGELLPFTYSDPRASSIPAAFFAMSRSTPNSTARCLSILAVARGTNCVRLAPLSARIAPAIVTAFHISRYMGHTF